MTLANTYTQNYGQLANFFKTIQQGQAPDQFTRQHLKDIGFGSSNYRSVIPLLKVLGFLSAEGQPTQRYHDYRDASQASRIMGQALKEAYGDLFVIRSNPKDADKAIIQGKFKSTHNVSDHVAQLMTNTFYALLALADLTEQQQAAPEEATTPEQPDDEKEQAARSTPPIERVTNLHYNIQIHLPATKDIEVFNAIFKSLREHLID